MALVDFDDDPYRKKVLDGLGNLPEGGVDSSGPGGGNLPKSPFSGGVVSMAQGQDGLVENPPGGAVPNNTGIAGPELPQWMKDQLAKPEMQPAASQPQGGYDFEKLRTGWAYGGNGFASQVSEADLEKFLADNQAFTQGVTRRGDKLYDPSGKFIFDAIGNLKGGDPSKMTRIALQGGGKKPGGGLTPVSSGQSVPGSNAGNPKVIGPGGAGGTGGTGAPPAANNFLTQIREQIMARLGKMSQDPSMSDPALASQSQAYRVARERGAQQQRAESAERAAANGTLVGGQSSGGFDTEIGGIREAAGEDIAGNDAQLLGNEVMQRRSEVQSLLNMALQSGDAESARMLQMQLAKMDEALRLKSLAENARQFNASDKYRYRALDENRRQWDDGFGRNLNRDYEDDYRWRALYGLGG